MTRGYHDIGGLPGGPIELEERSMAFWERRMEAMRDCLARTRPPVMTVDEMRRAIESFGEQTYNTLAIYERKAAAMRDILIEKGVVKQAELERRVVQVRERRAAAIRELPKQFDHTHDHENIKDDDLNPSEYDLISEAIYDSLLEQGVLSADEVRRMVERMEGAGPATGARIVARAWSDPAFKQRLLTNAKAALTELGIEPLETQLIVVENTAAVHNVIVCTLCSCYPRSVLGPPPTWYVSKAYRSRVVKEPRKVLNEFGTIIPNDVQVRVHDSNADMRYMVLPARPCRTDGWSENDLAALVTRDSLIGVAQARTPDAARRRADEGSASPDGTSRR